MNDEHQNYVKLLALFPSIHETNLFMAVAMPSLADVKAEVVERHHKKIIVTLSRHLKGPTGTMTADVQFSIAIYTEGNAAEVLTYRDRFGYRQVYSDDMMSVSPSTKAELNSFLGQWLDKLLVQAKIAAQRSASQQTFLRNNIKCRATP